MDQDKINEYNKSLQESAKEQALLDTIRNSSDSSSNAIIGELSKTHKVVVENDLAKPSDIEKVVSAVNNIKLEATDISPVVEALNTLGEAIAKLPTEYPELELPEAPEPVEAVSVNNLDELKSYFTSIVEAVNGLSQDIKFDPKIEVKPADVIINEKDIDLSKVTKGLESVVKAVQAIKTPTFDNTDILDGLAALATTINNLSFPVPNYVLPFRDADGKAVQAQLSNGALQTSDTALATRLDDSADPVLYLGKAPVGSAESSAVWQISKLDTSSGLTKTWAGTAGFNQIWDNRTSLTYS